MDHVLGLKCTICGAEYGIDEIQYVCPKHGDDGIVDVIYDYAQIQRHVRRAGLENSRVTTMWRYKPLLPVEPDSPVPPLTVGWTPLYNAPRIAAELARSDFLPTFCEVDFQAVGELYLFSYPIFHMSTCLFNLQSFSILYALYWVLY